MNKKIKIDRPRTKKKASLQRSSGLNKINVWKKKVRNEIEK